VWICRGPVVGNLHTSAHGSHDWESAAMNDHGRKTANPAWVPVLAATLAVAGIALLVAFYLSQGLYPVYSWRYWNLAIGFGAVLAAVGIVSKRR